MLTLESLTTKTRNRPLCSMFVFTQLEELFRIGILPVQIQYGHKH